MSKFSRAYPRGHLASLYIIYYIAEYSLLNVYCMYLNNNWWHLLTLENKSSKDNEKEEDKWRGKGTERYEMERESMIDTVSEQKFLMDSYGWSWRRIHHWAHAAASQQEKAYWRTTCQPSPQRHRVNGENMLQRKQSEAKGLSQYKQMRPACYNVRGSAMFETTRWLLHPVFIKRNESDLCNIFAILCNTL